MLDTDRWLEDRLRVALREEAEALPFTLTFADLERRLAERRTMRRRVAGVPAWWAAAALLLLAGAAVVGAVLLTEDRTAPPPPPAPTTIPSAVVPVNLPSTAELLVDVPGAIVRLEHRYDPAVDAASPAPGGRFELGPALLVGLHVAMTDEHQHASGQQSGDDQDREGGGDGLPRRKGNPHAATFPGRLAGQFDRCVGDVVLVIVGCD